MFSFKPGVIVSLLIMILLCSCGAIYAIKFGRSRPNFAEEIKALNLPTKTPTPSSESGGIRPDIATQWSHDIDAIAGVAKVGLIAQTGVSFANALNSWAWILLVAFCCFIVIKVLGGKPQ